jgi:hypothetical protein
LYKQILEARQGGLAAAVDQTEGGARPGSEKKTKENEIRLDEHRYFL